MEAGKIEFFRAYALMFGVTAAVYAFLRFSRAIATLARRFLFIPTVEFFDVFSLVQAAQLAPSADSSFHPIAKVAGLENCGGPGDGFFQ